MNKFTKAYKALSRVDVQVFLLTACMVVISSACIFFIDYRFTHQDMLLSLTERVESIYSYLDEELDADTFVVINTKEDMDKECYRQMKDLFFAMKQATGVQYLYTAKRAANGQLVYVVDGLDYSAEDFRYPGDSIEPEIVAALERALNNEWVMPDDIKRTPWGDIFIAYLPIHGPDGAVIGAIGIEFEATHQYTTYQSLRRLIPIVILLVCLISGVTALLLFRRLSNPFYQDLANTDALTGLKNRNAYQVDTRNLAAKSSLKEMGLLLADLNGLKGTNDTLGHEAGDRYLCAMAAALREAQSGSEVLYRMGGDEFMVLIPHATSESVNSFIARLEESFARQKGDLMPHASFAIGYAICDSEDARGFDKAYNEADDAMYACKKQYYEENAASECVRRK